MTSRLVALLTLILATPWLHADSSWVNRYNICRAAIAANALPGPDLTTFVFSDNPDDADFIKAWSNINAFPGTFDGKAVIWVTGNGKAYHAQPPQPEKRKTNVGVKGYLLTYKLKVIIKDRPPAMIEFRADTADDLKAFDVAPFHTIGRNDRSYDGYRDVKAEEDVTDQAKAQSAQILIDLMNANHNVGRAFWDGLNASAYSCFTNLDSHDPQDQAVLDAMKAQLPEYIWHPWLALPAQATSAASE